MLIARRRYGPVPTLGCCGHIHTLSLTRTVACVYLCVAQGIIMLKDISAVEPSKDITGFVIQLRKGRKYPIIAATAAERTVWIEAIQTALVCNALQCLCTKIHPHLLHHANGS